jgi:hypothetical protein
MMNVIGAKGTNAYTWIEQTVYTNDIPANQLEKWLIIDLEMSPCFNDIKSNARYQEILNTMKSNWQHEHEKVNIWLKENNLL